MEREGEELIGDISQAGWRWAPFTSRQGSILPTHHLDRALCHPPTAHLDRAGIRARRSPRMMSLSPHVFLRKLQGRGGRKGVDGKELLRK